MKIFAYLSIVFILVFLHVFPFYSNAGNNRNCQAPQKAPWGTIKYEKNVKNAFKDFFHTIKRIEYRNRSLNDTDF